VDVHICGRADVQKCKIPMLNVDAEVKDAHASVRVSTPPRQSVRVRSPG